MAATEYAPAEGTYPGRPPCASCSADFHLHRPSIGRDRRVTGPELAAMYVRGESLWCPTAYRPATLDDARTALDQAAASGDESQVFVARGNQQRLLDALIEEAEQAFWSVVAAAHPGWSGDMDPLTAHTRLLRNRHDVADWINDNRPTDASDHWPVDHAEGHG